MEAEIGKTKFRTDREESRSEEILSAVGVVVLMVILVAIGVFIANTYFPNEIINL